MPRKVKMSPIITDSYVPPELNRRASVDFSAHTVTAHSKLPQPRLSSAVHRAVNPLDAYRVSAADRWQKVHDKALDLALSCKDDAYKMDAYVDVAIVVSKHLRQLQPSAWAKIKAYWAGL